MTINAPRRDGTARKRRGPRLFRVHDWKVRTKLGAVLTLPAVAFLAVAGVQTNASVHEADKLQQFTRQVQLARQITGLVNELQRERDRAAETLRNAARPLLADPGVHNTYDKAMASLTELSRVRAGVLGGWLRRQAVFDSYTRTITDLLALLPPESQVGSGG